MWGGPYCQRLRSSCRVSQKPSSKGKPMQSRPFPLRLAGAVLAGMVGTVPVAAQTQMQVFGAWHCYTDGVHAAPGHESRCRTAQRSAFPVRGSSGRTELICRQRRCDEYGGVSAQWHGCLLRSSMARVRFSRTTYSPTQRSSRLLTSRLRPSWHFRGRWQDGLRAHRKSKFGVRRRFPLLDCEVKEPITPLRGIILKIQERQATSDVRSQPASLYGTCRLGTSVSCLLVVAGYEEFRLTAFSVVDTSSRSKPR